MTNQNKSQNTQLSPPWYLSGWFISLLVGLAALFVVLIFILRGICGAGWYLRPLGLSNTCGQKSTIDGSRLTNGSVTRIKLADRAIAFNTLSTELQAFVNHAQYITDIAPITVANDTNVRGSIASNVLTLSWNGQLSDARLSSNVALLNANQTFSGNNSFSAPVQLLSSLTVGGATNLSSSLGVGGTLIVGGATNLNSTLTVAGATTINNNLTVTGSIGINGLSYVWPGTQSNGVLGNDGLGNLAWQPTGACATCITNGGNAFGSAISIGSNDANSLTFATSGTDRLTITAAGQVGIGTSPGYALDVAGDINSSTGLRVAGTLVCTISGCTAASGSGSYIQNGTVLQTTANFNIQSAGAGSIGGIIRGAVGQTANLQEWQDSGGVALGSINAAVTKLTLNSLQAIYVPDQTNFTGSMFFGNGGGSLAHAAGSQGFYNTGVGFGALLSNTTGSYNSAQGYQALYSNTTGSSNSAQGVDAPRLNTTGDYNSAQGDSALSNNTTGSNNSAQGNQALLNNTTGGSNSAQGNQALRNNTTGSNNSAQGGSALYNLTVGTNNTAVGYNTGRGITTGSSNTILGAGVTGLAAALASNIIIANGTGAIKAQNDGTNWTLTGAVKINSTGAFGTVEKFRVNTPTTVDNLANVVFGTSAATSKGLVIQGSAAQTANLQEWQNSGGTSLAAVDASGRFVATTLGAADTTTALCRNSSNQIATCSGTATGAAFAQGGNSFGATAILGTNDANSLTFETNNVTQATIAVGGAATFQNSANSTTAFRVLDSGGTNNVIVADTTNDRVGIGTGTAAPTVTLDVLSAGADASTVAQFKNAGATSCTVQPGGTGFACSSDARLKTNVLTLDDSTDIVNKLRGVSFNWISSPNGQSQSGFLAQELMQVIPGAVSQDASGHYVANYSAVVPYLVNAFQDSDKRLTSVEAKINSQQLAQAVFDGGIVTGDTEFKGQATFDVLASFKGKSVFTGDATFDGSVKFNGDVTFNDNSAGTIIVSAGTKQVNVSFSKALATISVVTVSPQEFIDGQYKVTNITKSGFSIMTSVNQANDVKFNWTAVQH